MRLSMAVAAERDEVVKVMRAVFASRLNVMRIQRDIGSATFGAAVVVSFFGRGLRLQPVKAFGINVA